MAQRQRIHLPMQETQVRSLGQEGLLVKEMATCSSILAWEIPLTKDTGGLQSRVSPRAHLSDRAGTHTHTFILDSLVAPGPSDPILFPL